MDKECLRRLKRMGYVEDSNGTTFTMVSEGAILSFLDYDKHLGFTPCVVPHRIISQDDIDLTQIAFNNVTRDANNLNNYLVSKSLLDTSDLEM